MRVKLAFTSILFTASAFAQSEPAQLRRILSEEILPVDVSEFQLRDYLVRRVAAPPQAKDQRSWDREKGDLRRHLLDDVVYHGWPREWVSAPPKFEETGVLRRSGYRIRKFRYEIVPGMYGAALLYEPEHPEGKLPAILNVNGHVGAPGKAVEYKQKRCANFARNGIVALSLEWFSCGELKQKENEHWFGGHLDLAGANMAGLFYLAMRRGLDFLYDLPNVDRERIGMTGLSGGGWQTILLSSLDERVRVSISVAGFSSLASRIEVNAYGDVGDPEQSATDMFAGDDYTHLVALRAPRPTLLAYNAEDDCCFRAPVVKPLVYDAIKPFFRLYGADEAFAWHENRDPGTHNYQLDNRLAAYKFFSRQFGLATIDSEAGIEAEVRTEEDLAVGLPPDNLTVLGLARKFAGQKSRRSLDSGSVTDERRKLRDIVRLQPVVPERVSVTGITKNSGVESKAYAFRMNNGLSATAVWLKAISAPDDSPATLLMADMGKAEAARSASNRINRGEQVLVVDLAFIGSKWKKSDAWAYEQILNGVGDRPLGIEAAQLIAISDWLTSKVRDRRIALETDGIRSQTIALVSAAFRPELFSSIQVRNGMQSLSYLIEKPVEYADAHDLFCLDLLKEFDIEQLTAIAKPTSITNVGGL